MRYVVILAGGQGKRFGHKNKALIKINNITFIERLVDEFLGYAEIVISTRKEYLDEIKECLKIKRVEYVIDEFDEIRGPISGILSTLTKIDKGYFLFIPVDRIFSKKVLVDPFFMEVEKNPLVDAVITKVDNQLAPFPVLYSASLVKDPYGSLPRQNILWEYVFQNFSLSSKLSVKSFNNFIVELSKNEIVPLVRKLNVSFVNLPSNSELLIDINSFEELEKYVVKGI